MIKSMDVGVFCLEKERDDSFADIPVQNKFLKH
jgi:hypothetical protein